MPQISFTVAVGVRGPILPGIYNVGHKNIQVSYPPGVTLGGEYIELPKSLSTLFVVSWADNDGALASRLMSQGFERHLPIYHALAAISSLLLSYKLVRTGHADGRGLRTVGIGDTLVYFSSVDGKPSNDLNIGLKYYDGNSARQIAAPSADPHNSTTLARPHIGVNTLPVARRYVRCYELLEHGFYSEAFIVSFSILDDLVQKTLHILLEEKGLLKRSERNELLRGIKENRLKLFLGPVLKLASGRDIESMWADSNHALTWLNETRNRIAHSEENVDYSAAAQAIFACIKVLVLFKRNGISDIEIPVELFRHAKITAAWTERPPAWVPQGMLSESLDFDS